MENSLSAVLHGRASVLNTDEGPLLLAWINLDDKIPGIPSMDK